MYFKDDSISREGVINTVKKVRDVCDTESLDDYRDLLTECFEVMPPISPESYKVKLKEIADALSEKFAYMNTCLNERDIILGYLGVKRPSKTHCNTDCTNTKCESHPLSSAQPEIVRCKDCKWCEDADGLMCKNTASWVVATDYDFGCVLAERRQDG